MIEKQRITEDLVKAYLQKKEEAPVTKRWFTAPMKAVLSEHELLMQNYKEDVVAELECITSQWRGLKEEALESMAVVDYSIKKLEKGIVFSHEDWVDFLTAKVIVLGTLARIIN